MLIAGSLFILVIAEVGSSDRKIAWLKMFNFFINKKCICLVNSKITKDDHESLYVPYIKFNFLTSETATINNHHNLRYFRKSLQVFGNCLPYNVKTNDFIARLKTNQIRIIGRSSWLPLMSKTKSLICQTEKSYKLTNSAIIPQVTSNF